MINAGIAHNQLLLHLSNLIQYKDNTVETKILQLWLGTDINYAFYQLLNSIMQF